ncbi:16S rRNA (cytosine(967)-C(5))-methyltransferase RsmB [Pseudobacteriovorax antillogorgiicola]|uniref:16S rRNA (cytosine(967)-C(5))-methyltransferase n=1 Tax=Pseudobacteriovorax antillogorgiicola TaxID=1513793 RepID=A0A1Y6C2Y8_9BACT|nr:16S rRNA (cytosine(967)-C(5))-methyltransferase RsmB [Pseudobacteriovorax antillogorgiicola]TCS50332.1 NusB antitermination factor [Pseudobacteriovorax antillogorgiicola]SMF34547.1 16S rRNA (cytosine967-C5)-methyltransferase [Pseudobacteriovorax antillogorgiicola]
MGLSLAREIAYDSFVAVMEKKKKPEDVLGEYYKIHDKKLKRLDRNFIKEILYGSLRWNAKLFWILQNTSKRDLNKASPEIRAALVAGTYQIYYMDRVPDRAAVNESVEYIRKKGQASACSFVNGILRQISRRAEYFAKPDKKTQAADYLALQFSHPKWLVQRWMKHFKFEKLEVMLAANNQPPPMSIRINSLKIDLEETRTFQERLLREEKTHSDKRFLRSALRLKEAPKFAAPSLFSQGYYTVQDESSQLIGFLVDPQEGETVVDACAGPGGKLSHIYELGAEKITLIAIEKDDEQLRRAQENMERMGHDQLEWVQTDFLEWKARKKADKLLLDAPCTGLGVLRRHPEGKWHKSPDDLDGVIDTQYAMIKHGLTRLKVGGELIYSVCSFERAETEDHLNRIVDEYGDKIEIISPVSRLPDYFKKYVTRQNYLAVYAGNQDDMDGFGAFIIKLRKKI